MALVMSEAQEERLRALRSEHGWPDPPEGFERLWPGCYVRDEPPGVEFLPAEVVVFRGEPYTTSTVSRALEDLARIAKDKLGVVIDWTMYGDSRLVDPKAN